MTDYSRAVESPPQKISIDGRCRMGTFNGPIAEINILDLDQPLGFNAPRAINNFRLKEWLAFQLSNDDWFICLAVYNTKSVGIAIIMAFDKHAQRMYHYEKKVAAWSLHVPCGLSDSLCFYHSANFSIDIHNHLAKNQFEIRLSVSGFSQLPDISASWVAFHSTEPIVVVQPFADNRPLYSHKALMPLQGELLFGGKASKFDTDNSCAIVDDHKGFYPWVMQYDWVTGLGFNRAGGLLGFNLTDNQIQDHQHYNENCLWQEGKMIPLPPIRVERPDGVMGKWKIFDEDGLVALSFTPLADVQNQLNIGIARIDYHGPTGRFDGYIVDQTGNQVCLDGFIGMGEQKYIRM